MGTGSDRQSKGDEMTDDEIWSLARECGLMTKQPGTQAFDNALFEFSRRLITKARQDGYESAIKFVAKEPNK